MVETYRVTSLLGSGLWMVVNQGVQVGDELVAASPAVKQPATMRFRIVLYYRGESVRSISGPAYVVHDEILPDGELAYFHNGDYFPATVDGFVLAFQRWSERVVRLAQSSESLLNSAARVG